MSRQRELFDETFEIEFIWRIGETFDWTIDFDQAIAFDLTIYLMERLTFDRTGSFDRAGRFATGQERIDLI